MSPLRCLMVVDEPWVRFFGPASRRLILLARIDGHRDWYLDVLRVEEATLVFPVKARRRYARVGQPIERDIVEDLVTRQFAPRARGPLQRHDGGRSGLTSTVAMVEHVCSEGDGRICKPVQGLGSGRHQLINCYMLVGEEEPLVGTSFLR